MSQELTHFGASWTFPPGTRPGPQSARAGQRWSFRLPITGHGAPPPCHWSSPFLREGRYGVSDDTHEIWIDIPPDDRGVHKINYRLDAEPPLEGFVLLKVMAPGTGEQPKPAAPAQPHPGAPAAGKTPSAGKKTPGPPEDGKDDSARRANDIIANLLHGKRAEEIPPGLDGQDGQEGATQAGTGSRFDAGSSMALAVQAPPPPEEMPLPPGNYYVAAYRDDIPIPGLRTLTEPHKSLTAGKFSQSKNIHPDLDLKPHFKSRDLARLCSREQARIYWRDGRVMIRNIGKGDMMLPDDELEPDGVHEWREGEPIRLPGGLTLVLEKEA